MISVSSTSEMIVTVSSTVTVVATPAVDRATGSEPGTVLVVSAAFPGHQKPCVGHCDHSAGYTQSEAWT